MFCFFTGVGFHLGNHIQGLLGARLSLCHTPAEANMLKGLCSMVSTMIKKVELLILSGDMFRKNEDL